MKRRLVLLALGLALVLPLAAQAQDNPLLDPSQDPTLAPFAGQDCPPGQYWSPQYNQCVDQGLPPGTGQPPLALPGQGAPPPPEGCPPGLRWSPWEARCVQPSGWLDCGPYHRWSGHWRRCVPICPPGTLYNPYQNDCLPQAGPYEEAPPPGPSGRGWGPAGDSPPGRG